MKDARGEQKAATYNELLPQQHVPYQSPLPMIKALIATVPSMNSTQTEQERESRANSGEHPRENIT